MGTLSNFDVNLWQTMVCAKMVIFVKCHVFGEYVHEIPVVYWRFDASPSQRETLCIQIVGNDGGGATNSGVIRTQTWMITLRALKRPKFLSPSRTGAYNGKKFCYKIGPEY